jgi:ribosomal protein S18 acetylase RimI-like enzyme
MGKPSGTITRVRPSHAATLKRLTMAMAEWQLRMSGDTLRAARQRDWKSEAEHFATSPTGAAFLAWEGNHSIGQIMVRASAPSHYYVFGLYVEPSERRNGAASALVQGVLDWIPEPDATIMIDVLAANWPSINFWEKQGFTPLNDHGIYTTMYFDRERAQTAKTGMSL